MASLLLGDEAPASAPGGSAHEEKVRAARALLRAVKDDDAEAVVSACESLWAAPETDEAATE